MTVLDRLAELRRKARSELTFPLVSEEVLGQIRRAITAAIVAGRKPTVIVLPAPLLTIWGVPVRFDALPPEKAFILETSDPDLPASH